MFPSTTFTRFRRHLLVGAVAAATIVPAASAGLTRPPDVRDAASANLVAQLSPPDIRDAALGMSVAAPDVIERYATAHPFGLGLASMEVGVTRPPDIGDAALSAQYSSFSGSSSSFNWGDWAIGIATGIGIGLALLLGAGLLTSRQVRQRVRTA